MEIPVPEALKADVEARRSELVERLSEVDDEVADLFLAEAPVSADVLHAAVRRSTLALKFQVRAACIGATPLLTLCHM